MHTAASAPNPIKNRYIKPSSRSYFLWPEEIPKHPLYFDNNFDRIGVFAYGYTLPLREDSSYGFYDEPNGARVDFELQLSPYSYIKHDYILGAVREECCCLMA